MDIGTRMVTKSHSFFSATWLTVKNGGVENLYCRIQEYPIEGVKKKGRCRHDVSALPVRSGAEKPATYESVVSSKNIDNLRRNHNMSSL
jgi:hypothetical protein